MRRWLVSMAVVASMEIAHAADRHPEVGMAARVSGVSVACSKAEEIYRFAELFYLDHDREAAAKYLSAHDCHTATDVTGSVEHRSPTNAATCIRQRGNPDCFWFYDGAVERAD